MTPITDRATFHCDGVAECEAVSIETARALEEIAEELSLCLMAELDDSRSEIDRHIQIYGEGKYERRDVTLKYMRKVLGEAEAALAKYQAMKLEAAK